MRAEVIFPKWKNARNDLKNFVDSIDGFKVPLDNTHPGVVNISFNTPYIKDKNIEKEISLLDTFPKRYRKDVYSICHDVLRDIIPDSLLQKWKIVIWNEYNIYIIKNDLENHEKEMISKGNMCLKEKLSKKFGITTDYYKSKWNLK